jgi:hypothetical protein
MSDENEFLAYLNKAIAASADKEPACTVYVCIDSNAIEIITDPTAASHGEHIKGEGADICLYRDIDTGKVVGCRLAMYQKKVAFHCGQAELVVRLDDLLEACKAVVKAHKTARTGWLHYEPAVQQLEAAIANSTPTP